MSQDLYIYVYIGENLWLTLFLVDEKHGFLKQSERKQSSQIFKISVCYVSLSVKYYLMVFGFGFGFSE